MDGDRAGIQLRRYCPYGLQCSRVCLDAVDRDVVRTGIGHVRERSGRMDGDRAWSGSCGNGSLGR